MKQITILIMCLLIAGKVFNQTQPDLLTKEDYLKKSKQQKTAAWVLIAGGSVLTSAGIIAAFVQVNQALWGIVTPEPEKVSNTPQVLFISGSVMMLGSIPLFIASSRNKKNAKTATLSFKTERSLQVQNYSYVYRYIPSVSLKIGL